MALTKIKSPGIDTNIDIAGTLDVTGATTFDSTGTFSGLLTLDDTGANAGIQLGTGADFTVKRVAPAVRFNAGADLDHYEFCIGGTEKISFNADGGLTCAGAATLTGNVGVGTAASGTVTHHVKNVGTDWTGRFESAHASNPYGIYINYPNHDPNSSSDNSFIACYATPDGGSNTARFIVYSNGGIYSSGNAYFAGGVSVGGTGAANTLDDYEEGVFTPEFSTFSSSSTVSYTEQTGRYTKIGDLVYFSVEIRCTVSSWGNGTWKVTGLPFTCWSGYNNTPVQASKIQWQESGGSWVYKDDGKDYRWDFWWNQSQFYGVDLSNQGDWRPTTATNLQEIVITAHGSYLIN